MMKEIIVKLLFTNAVLLAAFATVTPGLAHGKTKAVFERCLVGLLISLFVFAIALIWAW